MNNRNKIHAKKDRKHHSEIMKKPFQLKDAKLIHVLISFLNINDILQMRGINSTIKNVIINSNIYKKYLKFRKEFIIQNSKEKIILVDENSRKINKKKSIVKYGVSYYIYDKTNNSSVVEKLNSHIDFNKFNIKELISNNQEKIKKLSKKYNLNIYEEISIISGLLEVKYSNEKLKIRELILNKKMEDGIFYLSKVIFNLPEKILMNIDLSGNNFKLNNIKIVSKLIKIHYLTLEKLNLSNNFIDDSSCKYLFNSLINCISIKILNLSKNQISNNGLDYAEKFLLNNITLTNLNLSNNLLGIKGIALLTQCLINNKNLKLKVLDLSLNGIETKGIAALSKYFKCNNQLSSLLIGGNFICDEGVKFFSDSLSNNSNFKLELLSFENNNISENGGKFISHLISHYNYLFTLDLKNNNLCDEGVINSLSNSNSKVITIDFSENNLGENSLKSINDFINTNSNLKNIILDNNNFKNYSHIIKDILINKHSNLKMISLKSCQIGENIDLIFEGLTKNHKLFEINLTDNTIGYYSKQFQSIIPCLNENKTLNKIILDSNLLNDEHLQILSDSLNQNKSLKEIHLNNNNFSISVFSVFYKKIYKKSKKCEYNNCGVPEIDLNDIRKLERKLSNVLNYIPKEEVIDDDNKLSRSYLN